MSIKYLKSTQNKLLDRSEILNLIEMDIEYRFVFKQLSLNPMRIFLKQMIRRRRIYSGNSELYRKPLNGLITFFGEQR